MIKTEMEIIRAKEPKLIPTTEITFVIFPVVFIDARKFLAMK